MTTVRPVRRADLRRADVVAGLAGLAALGAASAAFAALADSASEGDGIAAADPSIAAEVVRHRSGLLTHLAHVLTTIGSEPVVAVVALVMVVVLLERRGPRHAAVAAVATGTAAALTIGVKTAVARARPGAVDRLGALDRSYSFPSGHALTSAVLLGTACLLLLPLVRCRTLRVLGVVGAIVLAAGIGASRVYLGYHWTSDVLASWALAACVLAVATVASRWADATESNRREAAADRDG